MKLNHDKLLSNFAFNCKPRHYTPSVNQLSINPQQVPFSSANWNIPQVG